MILSLMSLLLSVSSVHSATGVALSMGTGLTYLTETGPGKDRYALGSVPVELGVLHHRGAQWYGLGVSWMFGASTATDSRSVKAHLFGLHADVAHSIFAFDYADIKIGAGAAVRYASVELGAWDGGEVGAKGASSRETRHQFISAVRAYPSLLLHGSSGSGGLEVVPLRIEYGPSLFQLAPSVAYSMFF